MNVRLNSDHNIEGHERLADYVKSVIEADLEHFSDRITRVEVYLSDKNAAKNTPNDKSCRVEARLAGMKPLSVSDDASALSDAISGASVKMRRMLESTLGKQDRHFAPS